MHIKITRSLIPNLFTLMNTFCGFLSILNSSEGNYIYASVLIIIAALFDMVDGIAARITKSASEFGVELDSLSDVVSFGAAPAFLAYKVNLFEHHEIGLLFAGFYLICGTLRLARFNVQLVGFDKKYFYGIPIPVAAIVIAASIITFYDNIYKFPIILDKYFIFIVIIISFLMVSKIKYPTLPKPNLREIKAKPIFVSFIFISIIAAFYTKGEAIFYIINLFILYGIFNSIFEKLILFFSTAKEKTKL